MTERSVLDSAATVWAVLMTAEELPALPERREQLVAARSRLNEYLAAANLSEEDLRCHLVSTERSAESAPPGSPTAASDGPGLTLVEP